MRIGIGPFPLERTEDLPLHDSYQRVFAYAELAEEVGLDAIWVDSNHFTEEEHGPSPLLTGAALASRTRTIAIGVATLTLSMGEHPLHVAEEALVLDALSGGRLILGVGLGYRDEEMTGFGVDPADRRGRFDDALAILQSAFADLPEFPMAGERYRVASAVVPSPRPVRAGGPPIWIGGGWHPAAVRRVARLGLPLISQFFETDAQVAAKVKTYRDAAQREAAGLSTVPVIRDVVVGDPEALIPILLPVYRRYARWGMPLLGRRTAPEEIGPAEVRELAWLGDEAALERRLRDLIEAGATELLARADLPGVPRSSVETTIRALGRLRARLGA